MLTASRNVRRGTSGAAGLRTTGQQVGGGGETGDNAGDQGGGHRPMTGLRVGLAEDDVLLREGLASLLERSGLTVLGQAGDGDELLTLARRSKPDVVVVDVRMPPTHTTEGLQAARALREELPETGILV